MLDESVCSRFCAPLCFHHLRAVRHLYADDYRPDASRLLLLARSISTPSKPQTLTDMRTDRFRSSNILNEPAFNGSRCNETLLYHTEEIEVLSTPFPQFKIDEWMLVFDNKKHLLIRNRDERVFFIIKTAPIVLLSEPGSSALLDVETTGVQGDRHQNNRQCYLIDEFANRIACKQHLREEMLYETTFNNFYMLVIYWCEGTLRALQGNSLITEIGSIHSANLNQIRNTFEEYTGSSSSSLAVYSSFASLNADKELRGSTDKRISRPFSLLELLYEQDHENWSGSLNTKKIWSSTLDTNYRQSLFVSDTALNLNSDDLTAVCDQYKAHFRRAYHNRNHPSRQLNCSLRYRSCSPALSIPFSAPSSTKRQRAVADRLDEFSRNALFHFFNSSSVPTYIQRRRRHCDSEPSSSSSTSAAIPEIDLNARVSRSSTFFSDDNKDLFKCEQLDDSSAIKKENKTADDCDSDFLLPPVNKDETVEEDSSNKSRGVVQPTDSPRDRVLPLQSRGLNWCQQQQQPANLFYDNSLRRSRRSLSWQKSRNMPNNSSTLPHTESHNHLFVEFSTEHFKPRRRHSLTPESKFYSPEHVVRVQIENYRRRSLSPLSLSLLANFGSNEIIKSVPTEKLGFQNTDPIFQRNRCIITPRRQTHSMTSNGSLSHNNNGVQKSKENGIILNGLDKPKSKPPTILIYTGDKKEQFERIAHSLQQILPRDTYTVGHLSTKALRLHPWLDANAACLLIADTKLLDDQAWIKLQSYFVYAGKILFVCQNSLVANLTHCDSIKKQVRLLKDAFNKKTSNGALGKDFEVFMKKALKTLNKCGEVNETFHAKDIVGGYRFSVVFYKKADQPLMLYMENSEHRASALFSDATTDQLLSSAGQRLIAEAMSRLGIQIRQNEPSLRLTRGYLICQNDQLVFDMNGLSYGEELGKSLKLIFRPTAQLVDISLPNAESSLLPIEVRRRKTGIPCDDFNMELYFNRLQTKSLGRAFLHVPVCDTTIKICKSLNQALPTFDGIVVSSDIQRAAIGRGGNQWLSPKGSISFSFDFNIPLNSELGKNVVFLQHILAVSIVDAVLLLLKLPDFPLRIKWPNDIYYGRSYKMGGILVTATSDGSLMRCIISAGINVANSNPTVCINDMLPVDHPPLTVEETLAEIMNMFERYVNVYVNGGRKRFLEVYERLWLHSREEVTVIHEENGLKDKVIIRGLDPNGYLEVRSKATGKLFSVFDDGNTFDMLKGLIRPKE